MKTLSLNVHGWLEEETLNKIKYLADTIIERNYDIIALQEVNQSTNEELIFNDIKKDNYGLLLVNILNELSNKNYSLYWSNSHIGYDKFDEGIALITTLPVYGVESFYCSTHKNKESILSRKIIGVTVLTNGQLVTVYSCHINLPTSQKENQLSNIKSILERNNSDNLKILMGDFNIDYFTNNKTYLNVIKLGLFDCYFLSKEKDSGITVKNKIDGWKKSEYNKRLDYTFINKDIEVLSSKVIFNGTNRKIISDHFGIETEIII